jgi:hypothetical protein
MPRYLIEDEFHCELMGAFETEHEARLALADWLAAPWSEPPNCPPCETGLACCREFVIVDTEPEDRRIAAVRRTASGVWWEENA